MLSMLFMLNVLDHPSRLPAGRIFSDVCTEPASRQGNYVEAEGMYQQALDMRDNELGRDCLDTLKGMQNLALLQQK